MEFSISVIILVIIVSFVAQFLNTALGEGFGTIVVPSFILLGSRTVLSDSSLYPLNLLLAEVLES